jgi:hypothetical protein
MENELKHPAHPEGHLVDKKPTGEPRWLKRGNETVLQQEYSLKWSFDEDVFIFGWTREDRTKTWIDTPLYTVP